MDKNEEAYRYRLTHQEVYRGISQKGAAAMIMDEYPEYTKTAELCLQEGGDAVSLLSILDSFY